MRCEDVHKRYSLYKEWRKQGQDDVEHNFDSVLWDEETKTPTEACLNCMAKKLPTNL